MSIKYLTISIEQEMMWKFAVSEFYHLKNPGTLIGLPSVLFEKLDLLLH